MLLLTEMPFAAVPRVIFSPTDNSKLDYSKITTESVERRQGE
jgi:hypothetical protein